MLSRDDPRKDPRRVSHVPGVPGGFEGREAVLPGLDLLDVLFGPFPVTERATGSDVDINGMAVLREFGDDLNDQRAVRCIAAVADVRPEHIDQAKAGGEPGDEH